jgi:hypothetical protein
MDAEVGQHLSESQLADVRNLVVAYKKLREDYDILRALCELIFVDPLPTTPEEHLKLLRWEFGAAIGKPVPLGEESKPDPNNT